MPLLALCMQASPSKDGGSCRRGACCFVVRTMAAGACPDARGGGGGRRREGQGHGPGAGHALGLLRGEEVCAAQLPQGAAKAGRLGRRGPARQAKQVGKAPRRAQRHVQPTSPFGCGHPPAVAYLPSTQGDAVHLAPGLQEYHLREPPIRLFSVMRRSVTTAPVVATFMGKQAALHGWLGAAGRPA